MSENETVLIDPPPFSIDYKAAQYAAIRTAEQFRDANGRRPVQTITVKGPEAEKYFLGLAIVPILLLCFFIFFLLMMCGFVCVAERRPRSQIPTGERKRKLMIGCQMFLLAACVISWTVAVGFSAANTQQTTILENELLNISTILDSVSAELNNITRGALLVQNASIVVSDSCPQNITQVKTVVDKLTAIAEIASAQAIQVSSSVAPTAATVSDTFDQSADLTRNIFYIRNVIVTTISVIGMIASLAIFIAALLSLTRRRDVLLCCNRPCGRCCHCCTPLRSCIIIGVFLMIVLCAALHVVALAVVDTCSPNVNINLNRIFGEFSGFKPFATYNGTNLDDMCDLLNDVSNPPIVAQVVCYYQTCDPTTPFATSVLDTVNTFVSTMTISKNNATTLTITIDGEISSLSECEIGLIRYVKGLAIMISSGLWLLFYLSCQNINQVYSNVFYSAICSQQVTWTVYIFNAWIVSSTFTMAAALMWVFARPYLEPTKSDENSPGPSEEPALLDNTQFQTEDVQKPVFLDSPLDFSTISTTGGESMTTGRNKTQATQPASVQEITLA